MEEEIVPLYRVTDTSDETIINLYATWLITKGEFLNRGFRLPKVYTKNKRMWTAFRRIAEFLNGTEVEPRQFYIAQLLAWKNPYPMMFVSDKAIKNYEKYHDSQLKSKDFLTTIKKSLSYVIDYCDKQNITFNDYLFFKNGKTLVSSVHIQTGMVHPAIVIIHPRYEEWIKSLDIDIKDDVMDMINKALPEIEANFEIVKKIKEML